MAASKIITVFGATGAQGGAVARIFLQDPKLKSQWTVRAVTRDTTKEPARKLASQGAEVISANLNDKSSLVKAMTGATAVYGVTNYWDTMDKQGEFQQGKNLVDAAKEAGIDHLIWSSLLNVTKLSNGKLPNVYHFDSKAEVEEYARENSIPATFFLAGFYMSNIPGGIFRPSPSNNAWTFGLPVPETAPLPLFDTADTGKFVKAIVLRRDELLGKRVLGATAYLTGKEVVEAFKNTFPEAGKTASYFNMPQDMYLAILKKAGLPDFAATELLENMLLLDQFGYYGGAKLDESHAILEDKLTTWDEYIKKADAFKGLN
ncbi:NmrA-domain-containing protein [Lipomyces kononenkoae]|uniref:NmrA-domain-containing protein n=1 Tax=Lipomyces kononenkoae TaxID=34357 RepID=A0ACC3SU07_LIPKO